MGRAATKTRPPPGFPDNLSRLYTDLDVPIEDWGTVAGAVIAFAHTLSVPAGMHVSRPLRLKGFQIDFIRKVYNPRQPDGRRAVRQALLSVGRRNGKTLLAAVLVLTHLAGPLKKPNSTIVSAATTRKQATIVFRFVSSIVKASPNLRKYIKVIESTKRAVHLGDSSTYEAIAAEATSQYGEGLDLCVYDELAQAKNRSLYDALMTSLGSQPEPLMMIISTQSPDDTSLMSELVDYGAKVNAGEIKDSAFVCQLHSAPEDCDLMDRSAWLAANPALGDYRDEEEIRTTMLRAVQLPSLENTVRNLYLNQRVRAQAGFLSRLVYESGAAPIDLALFNDGRPVAGGLDLSARTDLTALVLACEDDDGVIHLLPTIWTPADTLDIRAGQDRAPYPAWVKAGHLNAVPGPAIDYDWVADNIGDITAPMLGITFIKFDRWRIDVMRQSLARNGIALTLSEHGQGFKDMSPALEMTEQLFLEGRIRHGGHPVLRWCFSNAIVARDPASNRKFDRSSPFGRIDAAVAAVMAIAALKHAAAPVDVLSMIG